MAPENDDYRSVAREGESRLVVERSVFLARACPVSGGPEARETLRGIRRENPRADHHCAAWVLGPGGDDTFSDDDREPSGSAGRPILGAIRARELTNTAVVVTRFFGGRKLGVRGLIEAYARAAGDALDAAGTRQVWISAPVVVECGYEQLERVFSCIRDAGGVVRQEEYGETARLEVDVRRTASGDLVCALERVATRVDFL